MSNNSASRIPMNWKASWIERTGESSPNINSSFIFSFVAGTRRRLGPRSARDTDRPSPDAYGPTYRLVWKPLNSDRIFTFQTIQSALRRPRHSVLVPRSIQNEGSRRTPTFTQTIWESRIDSASVEIIDCHCWKRRGFERSRSEDRHRTPDAADERSDLPDRPRFRRPPIRLFIPRPELSGPDQCVISGMLLAPLQTYCWDPDRSNRTLAPYGMPNLYQAPGQAAFGLNLQF